MITESLEILHTLEHTNTAYNKEKQTAIIETELTDNLAHAIAHEPHKTHSTIFERITGVAWEIAGDGDDTITGRPWFSYYCEELEDSQYLLVEKSSMGEWLVGWYVDVAECDLCGVPIVAGGFNRCGCCSEHVDTQIKESITEG